MINYAYEITEILSPVIGEELAGETVRIQCERMGISPQEITRKNIVKIAAWVEKVLIIFADREIASEIKEQILMLR